MNVEISLSTWSKFHFFELARQIHKAGLLKQVFTNIPRYRLAHEEIPQKLIESNPFPAVINYALKYFQIRCPATLEHHLEWVVDDAQQRFIRQRLRECDVFVALSGAGLFGGRLTQ